MTAFGSLADRWREKAEQIRPYAPAAAQAFEDAASDLASAVEGSDDAKLRLKDAAQECGYSADHLSRMVRDGQLANYGRKHSPLVRRGDLPRKPVTPIPAPASAALAKIEALAGRGDGRSRKAS